MTTIIQSDFVSNGCSMSDLKAHLILITKYRKIVYGNWIWYDIGFAYYKIQLVSLKGFQLKKCFILNSPSVRGYFLLLQPLLNKGLGDGTNLLLYLDLVLFRLLL